MEESKLDASVENEVSNIEISLGDVRSSKRIQSIIKDVLERSKFSSYLTFNGKSKDKYNTLLNNYINNISSLICIPYLSSLFGFGSAVTNYVKADCNTSDESLISTIKFLIQESICLFCIIVNLNFKEVNSDVIDNRLSELTIAFIIYKSSPVVPLTITIRHTCNHALSMISQSYLGVTGLSDEITSAIESIASTLSLNSSKNNLKEHSSVILPLFKWLRIHRGYLVGRCRVVELIETVDPKLRAWLKGEEYSSSQHILDVYYRKYASKLKSIPLPIPYFDKNDVVQALRDLDREIISLNSVILNGADAINEISELLYRILPRYLDDPDPDLVVFPINSGEKEAQRVIIDTTLRYILISASRTIAGGDGFFVLDDLYGSADLIICPETVPVNLVSLPINKSRTSSGCSLDSLIKEKPSFPCSLSEDSNMTENVDRRKRTISNEIHSVLERNKVSIVINDLGAKIILEESYDLFNKIDIENSLNSEIQPLISFDLSTKTMIKFDNLIQLLIVNKIYSLSSFAGSETTYDKNISLEAIYTNLVGKFLEDTSGVFCRRSLSIIPRATA